jgi:hypothetical protein
MQAWATLAPAGAMQAERRRAIAPAPQQQSPTLPRPHS